MSDQYPAHFPELIDSSMRVTFRECPQKFYRNYCQGLRLPVPNVHLHAGGAFARGIEVAREAYYIQQLPVDIAISRGARGLTQFWGAYDPPEKETKQFWRVMEAFFSYWEQWPLGLDPCRPYRSASVTGIEFSFALPLPIAHPDTGQPLLFGGRLDMIGDMGGELYGVDEKTTGLSFYAEWSKQWELRSQFLGYTWALQSSQIPCDKFLIRGISIQKQQLNYTQAIVVYPEWQVKRWYNQMLRDVQRMVIMWETGAGGNHECYFDMDYGTACSNRGLCPYFSLCTSQRPEDFESMYEQRFWNPLAKDPSSQEISS